MRYIFGLEMPEWDPEKAVASEGEQTWFPACVYAWLTMVAALLSASVFMGDPVYVAVIGGLLVVAFPVTYYLHYTRVSRLKVNWVVFLAALGAGAVQFGPLISMYLHDPPEDVYVALRHLVAMILWIMAYRAFSLRSISELVQTILPTTSVVLLSLVAFPHWSALAAMAVLILGSLALLSMENSLKADEHLTPVSHMSFTRARRSVGTAYSWPAIYLLAIFVAVGIGFWTARAELSSTITDRVRLYLARRIARRLIMGSIDHAPGASIWLPRVYPPNGRTIVMEVKCERPTNWRTGCYHTYEGQSWKMEIPVLKAPKTGANEWSIPQEGSGLSTQAPRILQRITPHVHFGSAIPAAFRPVRVRANVPGVTYATDGTIAPLNQRLPQKTYWAVSTAPMTMPTATGVRNPPPKSRLQRDLQLPEDYPERVKNFTERIIQGAETEFDRARAIERYLADEYEYDLSPPSTWPDDFVEGFLFNTQAGYCYHFASAMVIMCRTIGIPARMAVGFMRGETSTEEDDLMIVRSEDAHAWPEVYITGAGWMPFEPTPAARETEERTFGDVWRDATATVGGRIQFAVTRALSYWYVAVVVVLFVVLAAVSIRYYLQWLSNRPPRTGTRRQIAKWAYRQMRRILAHHGANDRESLSAEEFLATIPDELPRSAVVARAIAGDYTAARFAPGRPEQERIDRLVARVGDLRETLHRETSRKSRDR